MNRWLGVAASVLALGSMPAMAEDSAQAKDREHEAEIRGRMKARSAKEGGFSKMNNKERADQAADATRAGGARTARAYHGAVHSTRKGVHRLGKKVEKSTE